jgi:ribulose-5-phosphate 4-epimerase/fuculose-1-phosphate aldolase
MAGDASLLQLGKRPHISDVEELRQDSKARMAAAFRVFAKLGLNTGPGGHAAFRDPVERDSFWTNPFGRNYELLRASDMILVDSEGRLVEGNGIVNRAAFCIHSGVHAARSDVNASVHLHGVPGMAWSAFGRLLDPLVQDSCTFYEDHAIFSDFDGPAFQPIDGERIGAALGQGKAMILEKHGLLTVGETIDEAAFWMVRMQYCCDVQLRAQAAGVPTPIEPELARQTARAIGTHDAGWFSFQSLYEGISASSPDIRD